MGRAEKRVGSMARIVAGAIQKYGPSTVAELQYLLRKLEGLRPQSTNHLQEAVDEAVQQKWLKDLGPRTTQQWRVGSTSPVFGLVNAADYEIRMPDHKTAPPRFRCPNCGSERGWILTPVGEIDLWACLTCGEEGDSNDPRLRAEPLARPGDSPDD